VPNTTTGLFETLVAAASGAATHLQFSNALLDCVFTGFDSGVREVGETLRVNIPKVNEGDVVDIAAGPLQPSDTDHDTVDIKFDKHPSTSWVIKSWDKIRTPMDLQRLYLQPRLEGLVRKCNRYLAALVNTTNFDGYTLISGSGADVFAKADIAGAWKNLAGAGVPVDDQANLFLVTNTTAYGNMLGDSNFSQESIVGLTAAQIAQQRAKLLDQFGAQVRYDQHLAVFNAGKQPAIFMHRFAIAAVSANLPPSQSASVMETTVYPRPWLPVQVQMEYSLKDQGWLFNLHCGLGVKVVRKDFASLLETA
jgi:hypothetical protein